MSQGAEGAYLAGVLTGVSAVVEVVSAAAFTGTLSIRFAPRTSDTEVGCWPTSSNSMM